MIAPCFVLGPPLTLVSVLLEVRLTVLSFRALGFEYQLAGLLFELGGLHSSIQTFPSIQTKQVLVLNRLS